MTIKKYIDKIKKEDVLLAIKLFNRFEKVLGKHKKRTIYLEYENNSYPVKMIIEISSCIQNKISLYEENKDYSTNHFTSHMARDKLIELEFKVFECD